MRFIYNASRYIVSSLILLYGFAKLNGSQFTILNSELDKPLGQVSGFWLTWHFFGYSTVYGNLIALAQIAGGVLLMFRRTTLLGACLLFPIVANIILVDIFYSIAFDALLAALLIEICLTFILLIHWDELVELFWSRQNSRFPSEPSPRYVSYGKHAMRVSLVVLTMALTYWLANYNNRVPTPLDGTWDVIGASDGFEMAAPVPSVIFFERNRAHLCVFKYGDGSYGEHHFEVEPATQKITIWQHWLRQGAVIFAGRYELDGAQLQFKAGDAGQTPGATLTLKKRR